jgi:lysophospholipase L1-like esterase
MKIETVAAVVMALGVLLQANSVLAFQDPKKHEAIQDFTGVDPASLGVRPVPARKDPKTGFVVGGKNSTALIRSLTEINGRRIADLEPDMRPGAESEVGSDKGFLGKNEALLGVLADDNRFVVEESGLTHRELAEHLLILAAIGGKMGKDEFRYYGRRVRVRLIYSRGFQPSPLRDGTKTNVVAVVENVDNGKEVEYSLLVPEMARRYGFYEGKGTPYRVEPRMVLDVLDFLKRNDRPLTGIRRVVFLGDSITYSGQYVEYLEAYLRTSQSTLRCEFLNLGLPSETVSGLSESGHAEGAFPRPDLHERLGRVLERTRPDLIVACYGMNDGIYHPFSEERFETYQGGMRRLRERAAAVGSKVLHVTPPVFDPVPIRSRTLPAGLAEYRQPYEGYDDVLGRYSEWLLERKSNGWDVLDVHGPMKRYLVNARRRDPGYRLADDGVHVNATGHWLIAREILRHRGVRDNGVIEAVTGEEVLAAQPHGLAILKLVQQKQRLLKDAWLTAAGHKRPGMKRGLPLEEAQRQAEGLDAEIRTLLTQKP